MNTRYGWHVQNCPVEMSPYTLDTANMSETGAENAKASDFLYSVSVCVSTSKHKIIIK